MKYILLIFISLVFYSTNAQSGNNKIKFGTQGALTPHLYTSARGYHGEYEYSLDDRYSLTIGLGQVVGKDQSRHGLTGSRNGVPFDNSFFVESREGVNYIDFNILYRLFKRFERNQLKLGTGITLESIWVEYHKNINVVAGVITNSELDRHVVNLATANLVIENDFFLTSEIFLNAKIVFRIPNPNGEYPTIEEYIGFRNATGSGGGSSTSTSGVQPITSVIFGIGYRF